MTPRTKICPRCGGPFRCLSEAVERCACMNVPLPRDAAAILRSQYEDCVCQTCLAALAADAAKDCDTESSLAASASDD